MSTKGPALPAKWLLLIYTVPAEPSRKRAYIWSELKKIGAVYARDGVGALPEREEMLTAIQHVAAKVVEFEGQATLAEGVQLPGRPAAAVVAVGTDQAPGMKCCISQARLAASSRSAMIARPCDRSSHVCTTCTVEPLCLSVESLV